MPNRTKTTEKVRAFLAFNDRMPDGSTMWAAGGISLTWGDLRLLADYDDYSLSERLQAVQAAQGDGW